MIRILIGGNQSILRERLKEIIGETTDMVAQGETASPRYLLDLVRQEHWDLVVLDLARPYRGRGSIAVLRELKKEKPGLPVLILGIYEKQQYAARARRAGAAGYVSKSATPAELMAAIRNLVTGVSEGQAFTKN
jgi:DNA-binding NarL/FixJ family response regulator